MLNLINDDCFKLLPTLADESIDLILCDLPYNETGNKWDKAFNLQAVCKEFERLIKQDGAIVLTGTFRFGVQLFNAMPHLYKYDLVWEKENGTNVPNVNLQPFRVHEGIYVFGKGRVTNGKKTPMKYYPQKTVGEPYCNTRGTSSKNWKGSNLQKLHTTNNKGERHPKTIQKFSRERDRLHPTQKPVALLEFLIKSYTQPNDLVLDCVMGSGSTGVACLNTGRNFIGIEADSGYFQVAQKRISEIGGV